MIFIIDHCYHSYRYETINLLYPILFIIHEYYPAFTRIYSHSTSFFESSIPKLGHVRTSFSTIEDPVSVQLSHVPHGAPEHAVPLGFNQPSLGARVLRVFILVLQIYLGIAMIILCIWAGFKWHSQPIRQRSDWYQRIPPERD